MPVRRITVTESFAEIDLGERLFRDGGDPRRRRLLPEIRRGLRRRPLRAGRGLWLSGLVQLRHRQRQRARPEHLGPGYREYLY